MCTAIYIAAERPLPLVEWTECAPSFYVALETSSDVRQHFRWAHVYYVGSYQGCGCGLAHEPYEGEDRQEDANTRKDWQSFADYLDVQLGQVEVIELFTCWEGNQHQPASVRALITPSDIREGRFAYEEGTYAQIRRRA